MAKVSEKDIDKFFKDIGLNGYSKKSRSLNLFKALGIIPEVDEDGNRVLTPYELLSTPPKFVDGKEVPIVFAIKNRAKKIGRYTGTEMLFFYSKKNKVKEGSELELALEELKKKYRHAVFLGNTDEALSYLDLINSITSGMGDEFKDSYYNYALFYKKMKKQLMMDMFAHFFLTYFFKYRNNVREGLIKKSSKFRPYFEKSTVELSGGDLNDMMKYGGFDNSKNLDFGDIKSIKFENNFDEFNYSLDEVASTNTVASENLPKAQPEVVSNAGAINGNANVAINTEIKNPETSSEDNSQEENESEEKNEEEMSYIKNPKSFEKFFAGELDAGVKQDENIKEENIKEENNFAQDETLETSSLD